MGQDTDSQGSLAPLTLGLDISTTTVGWVLMTSEGVVRKGGWVDLSKVEGGFWRKVEVMKEFLELLPSTPSITRVFVEAPAKMFAAGRSSADVLMTLAKFNGIVCYLVKTLVPNNPDIFMVNVSSARKTAGIKVLRSSPKSTKEQVVEQVRTLVPSDLPWEVYTPTRGKNKDQPVLRAQCQDMADAWVVCYHGCYHGGELWE